MKNTLGPLGVKVEYAMAELVEQNLTHHLLNLNKIRISLHVQAWSPVQTSLQSIYPLH
jgi:hypothetical protein